MAYIGNSPENIQRGRRFVYEFKATAGQTVFSGTDLNNQTLDLLEENEMGVYLNGVRLADSDDYTVSGDTLTLVSAASLNDQLTVETQAEIANISSYTRAEADARYINYDGDIVAGDLQISGEVDAGSLIVDTDVLVVDASTNKVGIGIASPATEVHIGKNSANPTLRLQRTGYAYADIIGSTGATGNDFKINLNGNDRFYISNSSGGVGIGKIPEPHYSGYVALDLGYSAALFANDTGSDTNVTTLANNTYLNSTGSAWKYIVTDEATKYEQSNGRHRWFHASSGTAGTDVTWTNSMSIDTNGNVGIGTDNPSSGLHIETDTNPVIKVSRGTNNAANINLYYNTTFTGQVSGAAGAFQLSAVGSTTPMQFYTNGAKGMEIDENGNVSINSGILYLNNALNLNATASSVPGNGGIARLSNGYTYFSGKSDGNGAVLSNGAGTATVRALNPADGYIDFETGAGTQCVRIASSGNLLVGTTVENVASSSTESGVRMGDGFLQIGRSNNDILILNRQTSIGDIALFRQDGAEVGNIGSATKSGDTNIFIGNKDGDVGILFHGAEDSIDPINPGNGFDRSGAISLGRSGVAFKDLYLTGGIQFDSRSNKLDDYEEGTWNPVMIISGASFGYSYQGGEYIKIGSMVTVIGSFGLSSRSGGSGDVFIGGLPFTTRGSPAIAANFGVMVDGLGSDLRTVTGQLSSGFSSFRLIERSGSTNIHSALSGSSISGNENVRFIFSYFI